MLQQRRQLDQECGRQHAGAARTGPHHRCQVCRAEYGGAGWTSAPVRREDGEGEMSQKACGLSEIIVGRGQWTRRTETPNTNNSSNNTNQIIVIPDLEL